MLVEGVDKQRGTAVFSKTFNDRVEYAEIEADRLSELMKLTSEGGSNAVYSGKYDHLFTRMSYEKAIVQIVLSLQQAYSTAVISSENRNRLEQLYSVGEKPNARDKNEVKMWYPFYSIKRLIEEVQE